MGCSNSFKYKVTYKLFTYDSLNNQQWMICHKTPTAHQATSQQTVYFSITIYIYVCVRSSMDCVIHIEFQVTSFKSFPFKYFSFYTKHQTVLSFFLINISFISSINTINLMYTFMNTIYTYRISFLCQSSIYPYIYSYPQTDLFRSIRTHQCG